MHRVGHGTILSDISAKAVDLTCFDRHTEPALATTSAVSRHAYGRQAKTALFCLLLLTWRDRCADHIPPAPPNRFGSAACTQTNLESAQLL